MTPLTTEVCLEEVGVGSTPPDELPLYPTGNFLVFIPKECAVVVEIVDNHEGMVQV